MQCGFAVRKIQMKLPRRSNVEFFRKADGLLVDLVMALLPRVAARPADSLVLPRLEAHEVLPLLVAVASRGSSLPLSVEAWCLLLQLLAVRGRFPRLLISHRCALMPRTSCRSRFVSS